MRLTLQTYFDGGWHHAATLELKDDAAGFQGASIVDYDLDYLVTVASAEFSAGKRSVIIAPYRLFPLFDFAPMRLAKEGGRSLHPMGLDA
nr:hypothetical protein [Brucella intermedia]